MVLSQSVKYNNPSQIKAQCELVFFSMNRFWKDRLKISFLEFLRWVRFLFRRFFFSRKSCESIATPKFAPAAGYRIKWYYYPSSISRVKKTRSGEFWGIQIVAKRRKHFLRVKIAAKRRNNWGINIAAKRRFFCLTEKAK